MKFKFSTLLLTLFILLTSKDLKAQISDIAIYTAVVEDLNGQMNLYIDPHGIDEVIVEDAFYKNKKFVKDLPDFDRRIVRMVYGDTIRGRLDHIHGVALKMQKNVTDAQIYDQIDELITKVNILRVIHAKISDGIIKSFRKDFADIVSDEDINKVGMYYRKMNMKQSLHFLPN